MVLECAMESSCSLKIPTGFDNKPWMDNSISVHVQPALTCIVHSVIKYWGVETGNEARQVTGTCR